VESSAQYYRLVNGLTRERLGGLRPARLVLVSVDLLRSNSSGSPAVGAGRRTARRAGQVGRAGGAGLLLLCTNTMHKVADHGDVM